MTGPPPWVGAPAPVAPYPLAGATPWPVPGHTAGLSPLYEPLMPGTLRAARAIACVQGILWTAVGLLLGLSSVLRWTSPGSTAGRGWASLGAVLAGLTVVIGTGLLIIVLAARLRPGGRHAYAGLLAVESRLVGLAALLVVLSTALAAGRAGPAAAAGAAAAALFAVIGTVPATVVILLTRPAARRFATAEPAAPPPATLAWPP